MPERSLHDSRGRSLARRRWFAAVMALVTLLLGAWWVQGLPHRAAASGDLVRLRHLYDSGLFDIDSVRIGQVAVRKLPIRWTPLMYAVKANQPDAAQFLLDRGAKIEPSFDSSELRWAVFFRRPEVFEVLLRSEQGSEFLRLHVVDLVCKAVQSPDALELTRSVLRHAESPLTDDEWREVAKHVAAPGSVVCDLIRLLLDAGMPEDAVLWGGDRSAREFLDQSCD